MTFRTAYALALQSPRGMTADVGVRGCAPSTLGARLDALVAVGGRSETLLSSGPTGTQQNQQQAETEQLHRHPAVRKKLWDDELEWNNSAILIKLKDAI